MTDATMPAPTIAPNWPPTIAITLDYEGGNDDDPHDPGGRTSRGILQREWNVYVKEHPGQNLPADVWKAPQSAILEIYWTKYAVPIMFWLWPAGCDLTVFDSGVLSGLGRSKPWAAKTLKSDLNVWASLAQLCTKLDTDGRVSFCKRYAALRQAFFESLSTFRFFGKGWSRRCAGIESLSVKMVLKAAAVPAPQIKQRMLAEASDAKARSTASAAGAGSTATASGGGAADVVTQVDWSRADPSYWLGAGAATAVALFVLAYFVWWAWQHYQRNRAYQEQAATV